MIPCKNCITFAICKAQIQGNTPHSNIIRYLMPKCSLIKDYIDNNLNIPTLTNVSRFFQTGKEIKYNVK